MKQTIYFFTLLSLIIGFSACNSNNKNNNKLDKTTTQSLVNVTADVETDPVQSEDDAADDPSIWYNEKKPAQSRIIGTNKKSGLVVYNLSGKELYRYDVGRVNNVDIRYGFVLGLDTFDIAGATNRTYNSISLFKILKNGELETLSLDEIISPSQEVYGFCMYKSRVNGDFYACLVDKTGVFEQYRLKDEKGSPGFELARTFDVGGQCEGMVADDELGTLFIGEENTGVWKYDAEPDKGDSRMAVTDLSNKNLMADIEGLTLYLADNKQGYLIVSSQGNNTYAFFNRAGKHDYLGSIQITDGDAIDGTSETDGIDVINLSVGEQFVNGFFIVQDGENYDSGEFKKQNFKMVDWAKIATGFDNKLIIDNTFDYR